MFDFFSPIQVELNVDKSLGTLGAYVDLYQTGSFPESESADLIIFGVEEERNAIDNDGTKFAPDVIRKSFYQLFPGDWHLKIADLGNIKQGSTIDDTYFVVANLVSKLLDQDKHIIVLGGSQDLTYALSKAYNNNKKPFNLSIIDAEIDGVLTDSQVDNQNYLTNILTSEDTLLNNLNVIGIQTYYNHPAKYEIFKRLYVDYIKLSDVQKNILNIEPCLRDAHILSLDVSSTKDAYLPAQKKSRPNGLDGQEICILTRYSGLSVYNRILGIFEFNPYFDKNSLGANTIAQAMWYFIEGKNLKTDDYPEIEINELIKFNVENDLLKLIFYKNDKTGRWWVEVPQIETEKKLISCAEQDYLDAVNKKISNRIYNIFNKNTI